MIFKRRGACLAQSVKQLILGFGSGHDLMGPKTEPPVEPGQQSAWRVSLCPPPAHALAPSLSISLSKISFKKE